jgi:exopolyphosphatase / guanosine-5'-triphosphate,3'-diphosphate pyrophosphatase
MSTMGESAGHGHSRPEQAQIAGETDRRAVAAQLGREPLIPFAVVARCNVGHPLVIRNRPVDAGGNPFPTLFWLTCPDTAKAVSRLESEGWIKRLDRQAEVDPDLRIALRRSHEEYASWRGHLHPGGQDWGGVGGAAGGVKCLHAHYGFYLAGGADPIGAWVQERLAEADPVHYEKPARRVAAIDLGTNSIRLLVARFAEGERHLQELAREMVITRIGQGVDRTGRLAPDALRRTLGVLDRYARQARALGAERIHLCATSAVRDASNREELAAAVLRSTGEEMEVLSGRSEADLSFLGATRGLEATPPFLVLDIGGGSTEFVLGDQRPAAALSTRMGSVRMTERFVTSDPPSYEDLATIDKAINHVLAKVEDRLPVHDARTLVAVAGTSTTVQAIALGLPEYDPEALHRTILSRADAERVFRLLADMTTEERRALAVMAPGREDVIPAGAAILIGVMRRWGFEEALVSETDILDGIAYRMVEAEPGG